MRIDENSIPDDCSVENGSIVLDFHMVPNDHIKAHIHVLANAAIPADFGSLSDLSVMPNPGSLTDLGFGRCSFSRVDRAMSLHVEIST